MFFHLPCSYSSKQSFFLPSKRYVIFTKTFSRIKEIVVIDIVSGGFCRFELRLRISVSAEKLTLIPRVRNVDSKAFPFMFALRNYFSVSDIRFALVYRSTFNVSDGCVHFLLFAIQWLKIEVKNDTLA